MAIGSGPPFHHLVYLIPTMTHVFLLFHYVIQSELRKQELLAQLAAEEQRGQELTQIVRELLPASKKSANPERQPRLRRVCLLGCFSYFELMSTYILKIHICFISEE
jgi:hypothetical protein